MDNANYYRDGVARVIDLLRDTFGDTFKAYFNGQPEEIPEVYLPCIMVSETQGQIAARAAGTDDIIETIQIIVALNKKDDMGADPEAELTEFRLRKLVKGQDPVTGQYLPNTIMYALRKHITLNDEVIESSITTDFDIAQRAEDTFTQEAYITLSITRLAYVPERD